MRTFTFISNLLFVFFVNLVVGQSHSVPSIKAHFRLNKYREFKDSAIKEVEFFKSQADLLGLAQSSMRHVKTIKGTNQWVHQKYQQFYNNYPVYKGIYILHTKNGEVASANGTLYPNITIEKVISIHESECLSYILKYQLAVSKQTNIQENFKNLKKNDYNIKSNYIVVTDRSYPKFSGTYVYAYNIVVESKNPLTKMEYLMDAHSGRIIFSQSLIKEIDVPSRGKTKYYGLQNFTSDSIWPNYFALRDNERNISTFKNISNGVDEFSSESSTWNLTNSEQDEVALDAHYCTSRFYDMMKDHLAYIGLDGEGEKMNPIVHAGQILNAFWTGENAEFGDGDCNHGPLTSLSIVAHEFTHGVTERNSGLIYSGESGGLNEAYSDIFGKACEYLYDRSRFTWELDPTIKLYPYLESIRSFSNPNRVGNPKNYGGLYWQDGGEVHSTSNVLNHWFYLLVEGKSGVNEFNYNYKIPKQELLDIIKILFACQTSFLEPSSNYANLAFFSIKASDEIFGVNSNQTKAINEAWKAVNVKPEVSIDPQESFDLEFEVSLEDNLICQIPVNPEYIVTIRNIGDVRAKAGTVVPFVFYLIGESISEFSMHNGQIKLDVDIEVGEVYQTSINNLINFTKVGSFFVFVMFQMKDDNSDNNNSFADFKVLSSSKNDLGIEVTHFKSKECGSRTINSIFKIVNWSCDIIFSHTMMQIELTDNNNKVISFDYNLPSDLEPGDAQFVEKDLTIPLDVNSFSIELKYSKDEDLMNNRIARPLVVPLINKLMNFNFSDKLHEKHFSFNNNSELITRNFNSNEYLYTTGIGQGIPKVFLPCRVDSLNFSGNSNSVLSTCLDLSKIEHSLLSFDLVQFQSDSFGIPEVKDRTSILQLKWSDSNKTFINYIYGQKEGDITHYEYQLPNKFIGELEFAFYNVFGDRFDTAKSLNFDHQLLDNISISPISSTKNILAQFSIFPNPAFHLLNIMGDWDKLEHVKIYNLQGKLISVQKVVGPLIDIEPLGSGMYSIHGVQKNGNKISSTFVKI